MIDRDAAFESRLAEALVRFAAEPSTDIDGPAFAEAVAADHPRRPWTLVLPTTNRRSPLAWLLVAALLAMAGLLALAASGALRQDDDPLTVDATLRIPTILYGEWVADLSGPVVEDVDGTYTVDLDAAALVRGPDGPLEWVGRAVAFIPHEVEGTVEVVVRATGSCGEGRYLVRATAPSTPPGDPTPDPIATATGLIQPPDHWQHLAFTDGEDPCVDRGALLSGVPWAHQPLVGEPELGPFIAGRTYGSGTFTEPFTFVMPEVDNSGENEGLPAQFQRAGRYVSDGGLRFGGIWWSMRILDDALVNASLCDPASAILDDLPATPEAIGAWLRESGIPVTDEVEVPVDGRTALRFDLGDDPACASTRLPIGGFFGYRARAYATPTGDDTIFVILGSDEVNLVAVKEAVDLLVRSMDFE